MPKKRKTSLGQGLKKSLESVLNKETARTAQCSNMMRRLYVEITRRLENGDYQQSRFQVMVPADWAQPGDTGVITGCSEPEPLPLGMFFETTTDKQTVSTPDDKKK